MGGVYTSFDNVSLVHEGMIQWERRVMVLRDYAYTCNTR